MVFEITFFFHKALLEKLTLSHFEVGSETRLEEGKNDPWNLLPVLNYMWTLGNSMWIVQANETLKITVIIAILFSNGPKTTYVRSSIASSLGQCNAQSRVLARKSGCLGYITWQRYSHNGRTWTSLSDLSEPQFPHL